MYTIGFKSAQTVRPLTNAIAAKLSIGPSVSLLNVFFYKIPKRLIGPDLNKWDKRWAIGIFVGVRAVSNEVYVGTSQGVIKCRTIRRRVPSERWNVELLNKFSGTPWDPKAPIQDELSAEEQLKPLPDDERVGPVETRESNAEKRSFKIYRRDILKREREHGDGFTAGCPGCKAARQGTVPRNHSDKCREKYRKIFASSAKTQARVVAADARLGRNPGQEEPGTAVGDNIPVLVEHNDPRGRAVP